jgi:hypothetical protein
MRYCSEDEPLQPWGDEDGAVDPELLRCRLRQHHAPRLERVHSGKRLRICEPQPRKPLTSISDYSL